MAVARVPAGKTRKTRQIAGVVVVERDGKVGHRYIRGSEAGVRLVDGWELGAKRAEIPPNASREKSIDSPQHQETTGASTRITSNC